MNIQILDNWLKDHLKTKATAQQIAEKLSLTSVSIEKVEKYGSDFLYDIEVTTNRPDLASVIGLAREASAVLPQFGIDADFIQPEYSQSKVDNKEKITIKNDSSLIHRICAVIIEVEVNESPLFIKDRLEASGIRSLNNVIDVTNYVMRTIGHPAHVFDFDRLNTKELIIRKSKKGEKIVTLDNKAYELQGGDIIAEDDTGRIVDLIGIMGLENSVVTTDTKRILFFIDNNETSHIRNTSMNLGIRTEAAQLNEKGVDPELAYDALLYGIKLYQDIAKGKVVSDIIDIYPNKPRAQKISVSEEKINAIIGVTIPLKKSAEILQDLGFYTKVIGSKLEVDVPSFRREDVQIEEDLIEEIARVYGYHNLPSVLPSSTEVKPYEREDNTFYWEQKVKEALKFWGFTEVYTYSMVSENMYEGPLEDAVTIKNPLSEEWVYMRISLVPSLLKTIAENKNRKSLKIFEIANIYKKIKGNLPNEKRVLSGVVKKPKLSFHDIKGLLEQLGETIGIKNLRFKALEKSGHEIELAIGREILGSIEILDDDLIDFELDFEALIKHASNKKVYTPLAKYPPIIEDIALIVTEDVLTGDIIEFIKKQSQLITDVTLLDKYESTRTFHIVYQHKEKNLTNEEVTEIREKTLKALNERFNAKLKA